MVLLIDNYDSFSYNLYQLIGTFQSDIRVIRNKELTVEEIAALNPSHIILSPGSGRPKDAGICTKVVQNLGGKIPILGVCLGHQAIFEALGGTVSYAQKIMHGKQSLLKLDTDSFLFAGMPQQIQAARYHSLTGVKETLPKELKITAETESGEIMAIEEEEKGIYGVQFHPESILTPLGSSIIKNFLTIKIKCGNSRGQECKND